MIAQKLASGKLAQALDGLHQAGGIIWERSKEQAAEALIQSWAKDRSQAPYESSLIIAHSNREIKALNELARLYRSEVGELKGAEFKCETTFGKLYISVGDWIEFRKNDKELGVTNGLRGTLIHANEGQFVVKIDGEGSNRNVTFNPQKYRSFQLGYATTYYRAQGRTVDRAYILHSPMMSKEMFYVGLTRHVSKAELFVAKSDAQTLSDVKKGVFASTPKFSTLDFTTSQDINLEKMLKTKEIEIQELKASDSLHKRLKGMGLSTLEGIKGGVGRAIKKYHDVVPDQAFFSLKQEERSLRVKAACAVVEPEMMINHEKVRHAFQELKQRESQQIRIDINGESITQNNQRSAGKKGELEK